MPPQEILILAMTRMRTGVCTAGFTTHSHPVSRLSWVRPVKEFGSLLLGDVTDADGRVIQCGDVVEMHLKTHRPNPPHTEDWLTDFVYHRPCLKRRLEGERRACFLAQHLDQAPGDVMGRNPTRSLCLVRPDQLQSCFSLDPYSLKFQARIGFTVEGVPSSCTNPPRGLPVTDLKWCTLGRSWLREGGGELRLNESKLRERLDAQEIYLVLGLSRPYQGKPWLLVIGVHVVPDYKTEIEYATL